MLKPDDFGELIVRAILSAGLHPMTASAVSDKIVSMLRQDKGLDELLQVNRNAVKVGKAANAWAQRARLCEQYLSINDKPNRLACLDAIPGIGQISAETLDDKIQNLK